MGIPLWESPPDPKTTDKNSATSRCLAGDNDDRVSIGELAMRASRSNTNTHDAIDDYLQDRLDRERRMRLHLQLQNEQFAFLNEQLIQQRHSTNSRRHTQSERLSAYSGASAPTTSSSTAMQRQHGRPHIVQPDSSEHLVTLTEFLRETNELRARRDQAERHLQDLLRTRRENRAYLLALVDETYNEERTAAAAAATIASTSQTLSNATSATRSLPLQSPNASLTQPTTTSSTSTVVARARRTTPSYRLISNRPTALPRRAEPTENNAPGPSSNASSGGGDLGSFDALVQQIRHIGNLQDETLTESVDAGTSVQNANHSTDSSLEIVHEEGSRTEMSTRTS